jgi:hypothetical protein
MRIEAVALLALLAGCAPPAAPPVAPPAAPPDQAGARAGTVEVRLGGTGRLGDISVRPLAVMEDSRCPSDVACVWAGRLRLRAAVSGVGETELLLGQPLALPGGASLILVAAAPAPRQRPPPGAETGPATRFTFRRD